MGLRTLRLMTSFAILSLNSGCATPPMPVDSFCTLYTKVITEKGDGNIVAKSGPKRRILANEKLYNTCLPKN